MTDSPSACAPLETRRCWEIPLKAVFRHLVEKPEDLADWSKRPEFAGFVWLYLYLSNRHLLNGRPLRTVHLSDVCSLDMSPLLTFLPSSVENLLFHHCVFSARALGVLAQSLPPLPRDERDGAETVSPPRLSVIQEVSLLRCRFENHANGALFFSRLLPSLRVFGWAAPTKSLWMPFCSALRDRTHPLPLQRIHIRSHVLCEESAHAFFLSLPSSLETLDLRWCRSPIANKEAEAGCWGALGQKLKGGGLPLLKELILLRCGLTDDSVRVVFPFLPESLEVLQLSGNPEIGIEGWGMLGSKLKAGHLGSLRSLLLDNCGLLPRGGFRLLAFLPFLPASLETLRLQQTSRTEEPREIDAWVVQRALASLGLKMKSGGLRDLKHLSLSSCVHDGKSELSFLESLPSTLESLELFWVSRNFNAEWTGLATRLESGELARLKLLRLHECGLKSENATSLFAHLPVSLETLDLTGNDEIGPEGWRAVARRMEKSELKGLKNLVLRNCGLKNSDACTFLRVLPSSLESLDLSMNGDVEIEGWRVFGERLRDGGLPLLSNLRVSDCCLSGNSAVLLFPSLPSSMKCLDFSWNTELERVIENGPASEDGEGEGEGVPRHELESLRRVLIRFSGRAPALSREVRSMDGSFPRSCQAELGGKSLKGVKKVRFG